jgi:23S rRNA (uracil1939-C5)-methyltransferase
VGRLSDGLTIFVPESAPGDRLVVRITERRKRHARGEIERVVEPGPARTTPRCPVFGRCGGCSWQHIDYEEQLLAKQTILRDAMQRIGGIELEVPPVIVPSPSAYGYRARTRVLERAGAVGYRERMSHSLCVVRTCPVLMPELDRRLGALADDVARDATEHEREWQLALGSRGEVRALALDQDPVAAATDRIALEVGAARVEISAGTFAQGTGLLQVALHDTVCRRVGEGATLLELFAGAGFFSLELAHQFEHVQLVESDPGALTDLRANLAAAGLGKVQVTPLRVEDAIPSHIEGSPGVILLDPPRAGVDEAALRELAALGPQRIVYVSCDPATLSRDVARLVATGFRLASLEAFDLFPQTPHIESLAVLVPRDGSKAG